MAIVRLTSGAGRAGPDRLSPTEIRTSTSLFKSDQWSLLKKEVEVRWLIFRGANSEEIVDFEERNERLHYRTDRRITSARILALVGIRTVVSWLNFC